MADAPYRPGYLQASGGFSTKTGPHAEAEAGYRLLPTLGIFGRARWTPAETTTDAGLRWTF